MPSAALDNTKGQKLVGSLLWSSLSSRDDNNIENRFQTC